MRSFRITTAALAAVMALSSAGVLGGCGSKSEEGKSKTTKDGKIILEVLTNRTDRVDDGSLDELTKAFEEAHNCDVQYVGYQDYAGTVATRMGTDDYGDVLMIPDEVELTDLANFFEPIGTYDELSAKYRWADKKMDADKNIYGLAYGGNAVGVLYNKKVWADAGITSTPTTPEEFLADLKLIADNTDAIPYYTQYKDASWTITQWQSLVLSASGDAEYENKLLTDKPDLFAEDGGYYQVYKLMYDLFSSPDLIEEDHMTTEWESSKVWMGEGKIGTMVMGSWAIAQFQEQAEDPSVIGYMPVPITAPNGSQYAETASDYCVGVSKHSANKDLAKAYVEWFVGESGFAAREGMIPTTIDSILPANLSEFSNVVFFEKAAAPEELLGKFDEIDTKSGVSVWGGDTDNFKIKLAEAAFAGKGEAEFKSIIEAENKKWAAARDEILG
ncbi:ABC-type glycerol-3-phosphate transport system, substrate-binding protein [Ruminococcus sp. YE71]|uniref:ABC transporter substrate-binding protein n=1 Tax=unclassified Ruminococcus TaxID=2608920 RepID=UPI0008817CF0|nr:MULTISPECIES: extracellular solute-binding protein [unclassified Ruminococcus]SDA24757.1 ABC-type glycerol-3-phosphate transport system, substrate-binding protein [Ruminococcus sp. YE78]SFW43566.1 ABC-type glycerol-3-phosphate transport system, substrate-binding protein [Ruminococcus sp. YE71]